MIISKEYVTSGSNDAYFETLGLVFKSNLPWIRGGISFTFGAFLYYVLFYQTKHIPRWLAIFGLLAVVFPFTSYITLFFGVDLGELEALFHLPMLVQEVVPAVGLIVKGYDFQ